MAQICITVSKSGLIEHAALTGKCSKCLAGRKGPRFSKRLSSGCLHSQEKYGFSIDFTNGKSLLHKGEDPSNQYQYRIEGTNLQERAEIELGVLLSGLQRK